MTEVDNMDYEKVNYFIEMVIKKEFSWATLSIILDEMTPTLKRSKQVIKILLQILELKLPSNQNLQSK